MACIFFLETWHPSWFVETVAPHGATLEVDCSLLHAAVGTFFAVSQLEI